MRKIVFYECEICGCRYLDKENTRKCETTCSSDFVLVGNNRKEAFDSHIEFEKGFNDENNSYLKMSLRISVQS